MKTFIFIQKNGSGTLTLSAPNYDEAIEVLNDTVKDSMDWRVEDEDGEE